MARTQRSPASTTEPRRPQLDGKVKRSKTVEEMHQHYLQGATLAKVGERYRQAPANGST
jgi:hypothetical protein